MSALKCISISIQHADKPQPVPAQMTNRNPTLGIIGVGAPSMQARSSSASFSSNRLCNRVTCAIAPLAMALLLAILAGCGRSRSGHLRVPDGEVFIGAGKPGSRVSKIVTLENAGAQPLTIRKITTSCGCTDLRPTAPFTIEPRGSRELSIEVELPKRPGAQSVFVVIESEDATAPVNTFEVKATAEGFALVTPPILDFGRVRQGIEHRIGFSLLSPDGAPWPSSADLRFRCSSHALRVERVTDRRSGQFALVLRKDATKGDIDETVFVSCLESAQSMPVSVVGQVVSLFNMVPDSVVAPLRPGEEFRKDVFVTRADSQPVGSLRRVEGAKWLTVTEIEQHGTELVKRIVMEVQIRDARQIIRAGERRVRIWFGNEEEPALFNIAVEPHQSAQESSHVPKT